MRMGSPTQGMPMADISGFLSGSWLYRSFNPTYVTGNQTPQEEWGLIRADRAVLNLDSYLPPGGGSRQQPPYLRGALEWEGGGLNLNGTVRLYSAFESPDFVGTRASRLSIQRMQHSLSGPNSS